MTVRAIVGRLESITGRRIEIRVNPLSSGRASRSASWARRRACAR